MDVFWDLKLVLDDVFHWLQRILREVPDGHPMKGMHVSYPNALA